MDANGAFRAGYADLDLSQTPVRLAANDTLLDEGYLRLRRTGYDTLTLSLNSDDATPDRLATFEATADTLGLEAQVAVSLPSWRSTAEYILEVDDVVGLVLSACE